MFNLPRRISRGAFFRVRLAFALALISTGLLLGFFTFNVGATQVRLGPSVPRLLSVAPRDKAKIARWVLDRTANGRQAEFLVVLADQADLAAARAVRSKR